MIEIGRPAVSAVDEKVVYRTSISDADQTRDLWFEIPGEFGNLVSDRSEPALVALLLPAMEAGRDIRIRGPVSPMLVRNFTGPVQEVMQRFLPGLRAVAIEADEQVALAAKPPGIATGFTRGVDSFTVVRDHFLNPTEPGDRLTHLTFLNVGSHYRGDRDLYRRRLARSGEVATTIGLPLVAVDSNVDSFYSGRLRFSRSMSFRNVSAAYVLQRGVGRYLVASGAHHSTQTFDSRWNIQILEDALLPLLSSETLANEPSGSQYRRIEKVGIVSEIPQSYNSLHVCNNAAGGTVNCCSCMKCMRTIIALEILGCLDRYRSVFDLDRYRKNCSRFIARLYFEKNYVNGEVTDLIESSGYRIPIPARLMIALRFMAVRRLAERITRRIKRAVTEKTTRPDLSQ